MKTAENLHVRIKVGVIMKLSIFILFSSSVLLTGIAFGAENFAIKSSSVADNGRFQLFQGTYTAIDLKRKETLTQQAVFLIDTRTGIVKRYVNKIDPDGKYTEEWLFTDSLVEKK